MITAVAADPALGAAGDAALRAIGETPLYAGADFVRANDGSGYWLMELELIEPALYFRTDPGAAERFARLERACSRRRERAVGLIVAGRSRSDFAPVKQTSPSNAAGIPGRCSACHKPLFRRLK